MTKRDWNHILEWVEVVKKDRPHSDPSYQTSRALDEALESCSVEDFFIALQEDHPFRFRVGQVPLIEALASRPVFVKNIFMAMSSEQSLRWMPLTYHGWEKYRYYSWKCLEVLNEKTKGEFHDRLWNFSDKTPAIIKYLKISRFSWIRDSFLSLCQSSKQDVGSELKKFLCGSKDWWWHVLEMTSEEHAIFKASAFWVKEWKVDLVELLHRPDWDWIIFNDLARRPHAELMIQSALACLKRPVYLEKPPLEGALLKALGDPDGFCQQILGVNEAYGSATWQEEWLAHLIWRETPFWDSRELQWKEFPVSEPTRQHVRMWQWWVFSTERIHGVEGLLFWLDQLEDQFRWPDLGKGLSSDQRQFNLFNPTLPVQERLVDYLRIRHTDTHDQHDQEKFSVYSGYLSSLDDESWNLCLRHPILQKTPFFAMAESTKEGASFFIQDLCQKYKPSLLSLWYQEQLNKALSNPFVDHSSEALLGGSFLEVDVCDEKKEKGRSRL